MTIRELTEQEIIEFDARWSNPPSHVRYMHGDITRDASDLLVNTVNCVGVMGAGIAKAFAAAFPDIVPGYRVACSRGDIRPGTANIYSLPDGRLWAALATKDDWRNPSQLEWVKSGLYMLAYNARSRGVKSIAIGRPGCGHGGLNWYDVRPTLEEALTGFKVTVYL